MSPATTRHVPKHHGRAGVCARRVLSLLILLVLAPSGPATVRAAAGHHLLGYYVPYDATSWASLQAHAADLDLVGAQWVSVDACGNIGSRDDQTLNDFARAHGIGVVPSLFTVSAWLNHHLLTEPEVTDRVLTQIVEYTVDGGYAGFDLDLEGVDAGDRDALSDFVGRAATALHEQGKLLTLAVPAKDRDVTTGWAGAYDYAALGAAADLVTVMAYEYRGPFSGPGSVAPYDWVQRVLAFATQHIPPEHVLLGVAFYGYDWDVTAGGAKSLSYTQAAALAEQHGATFSFDPTAQSATFAYTGTAGDAPARPPAPPPEGHTIRARALPGCDAQAPAGPSPTRAPTAVPGTPEDHEVWIEDSQSAAARLALADRYGAGGVATWRLGLEDPRVWDIIDHWRSGSLGG